MAPAILGHQSAEQGAESSKDVRVSETRMTEQQGPRSAPTQDDELAEVDRLRSASVLSAGLAHEVANPLLVVLANLAELERLYPRIRATTGPEHEERWEKLADCLDQARISADAIADVVRDFQVFLR